MRRPARRASGFVVLWFVSLDDELMPFLYPLAILSQMAKRNVEMLFVRGDGVILVSPCPCTVSPTRVYLSLRLVANG